MVQLPVKEGLQNPTVAPRAFEVQFACLLVFHLSIRSHPT
jgi:hypothetical protein